MNNNTDPNLDPYAEVMRLEREVYNLDVLIQDLLAHIGDLNHELEELRAKDRLPWWRR